MSNDPIKTEQNPFELLQEATLLAALQSDLGGMCEASEATVAEFVGYLSGSVAGDEARGIERKLVQNRDSRLKLRETRKELTLTQSLPWETLEARRSLAGLSGEVATAWGEILRSRLKHFEAVAGAQFAGVEALREQAATGTLEAEKSWTALLAFGKWYKLFQRRDPSFAEQRGDEIGASSKIEGAPPNLTAELRAEVDSSGTLTATLSLINSLQELSKEKDGAPVSLSIGLGGELWRIGNSIVESGVATWKLPDAASILGLSGGNISAEILYVSFLESEVREIGTIRSLPCEIVDSEGIALNEPPAIATISSAPRIEAELFSAAVGLTQIVSEKYQGCYFTLDLAITANVWQRLGSWKLSGLEKRTQTLTAKCPGCPNLAIPFISSLRGRIVRT